MEYTYAQFISETEVKYPTAEEFPGVVNWQQHDRKLRAKHYVPMHNDPEPRTGSVPTPSRFTFTEGTAVRKEMRTHDPVTGKPFIVEDYSDDPEHPGQKIKIGEHIEARECDIVVDTSYITVVDWTWEPLPQPAHPSYEDYDSAMEQYLRETREARGYTDREPSDYRDSQVPRWRQDAADWTDFRDRVMLYGLDVLNEYTRTGVPPVSLQEFVTHLHSIEIHWTYDLADISASGIQETEEETPV